MSDDADLDREIAAFRRKFVASLQIMYWLAMLAYALALIAFYIAGRWADMIQIVSVAALVTFVVWFVSKVERIRQGHGK